MEASQYQVVVRVMPGVPDSPEYDPRPPVPEPCSSFQEEVGRYVFETRRCQRCRYLLLPLISLRIRQVDVQVSCHQKFGTPGALLERCDVGVVRGEVTSDDVPSPLPRRQMEANNVGPKLMDFLHRIMR